MAKEKEPVKRSGTSKRKIKAADEAKELKQNGWIVKEGFKQQALEILKKRPYNEVHMLITKVMEMDKVSDEQINEVINIIGQYPWEEVHMFMGGLVPQLVEPNME